MDAHLTCRDLTCHFGGVAALSGVTCAFEPGTVTAVLGQNGAGKSTLLNVICGSTTPDGGDVLLGGQSIVALPSWERARLGIVRLFQDVRIFDGLGVLDNVVLGWPEQPGEELFSALFRRAKMKRHEDRLAERARECLARLGLQGRDAVPAEALSYGEKKLVAIARLLMADARYYLLDEPFAGLNDLMIDVVADVIRWLARSGRGVVLIDHHYDVMAKVSDIAVLMDKGEVRWTGSARELLGAAAGSPGALPAGGALVGGGAVPAPAAHPAKQGM